MSCVWGRNMAPIFDLQGGGGRTLGDAIDTSYLSGQQLHETLTETERVAFVLVSKRGDVTIEREGETETYESGRRRRVVTVISDVQIVVAVGGASEGSDEILTIPLSSVRSVDTESGFFGGTLSVETTDGETWALPCKGEFEPVVAYLDDARRAWSRADRLLAEVDERLERARAALDGEDIQETLDIVEETDSVLAHMESKLSGFDIGASVYEHAGVDDREGEIASIRRRAFARRGAQARERARTQYEDGRYAEAADAYEQARQAYQRAEAFDASTPPTVEIQSQIDDIDDALRELRSVPIERARAAYNRVYERLDPVERAAQLETALERYRTVLELSWGPTAPFEGEAARIRARIVKIVGDIVDARTDAARRALQAARTFESRGQTNAALAATATAGDHVEGARTVATELAPDHLDVLDAWQEGIERHRDRIEAPATAGIAMVEEESKESSADDASEEQAGDAEPTTSGIAMTEPEDETDANTESDQEAESGIALSEKGEQAPQTSAERIEAALRAVDQPTLTRLVEQVWQREGWQTTTATDSDTQYDLVATRQRPVPLEVLVWTSPADTLEERVVDRCIGDRRQESEADAAAVVTTGDVPVTVRKRAADHNVKLLDRSDLVSVVERENLADRLPEPSLDD